MNINAGAKSNLEVLPSCYQVEIQIFPLSRRGVLWHFSMWDDSRFISIVFLPTGSGQIFPLSFFVCSLIQVLYIRIVKQHLLTACGRPFLPRKVVVLLGESSLTKNFTST
jgi:hypothetical protein